MRSGISWTADNIIYGLVLAEENVISRQETIPMSYSSMACMDLLGYVSSSPGRTSQKWRGAKKNVRGSSNASNRSLSGAAMTLAIGFTIRDLQTELAHRS